METQKKDGIDTLKSAYINLKNSKMVLAPKHISTILKAVAEDENIYNLIAQKILGFDFGGEYKKLVAGEKLIEDVLSEDNIIPFVFCLLNEIDNHEIELIAFIKHIFGSDSEECFGQFCDRVVSGFVMAIVDALGSSPIEEEEPDASVVIEDLFKNGIDERVRFIVLAISEKLATMKKVKTSIKRDIDITCFSIDLCLNLGQVVGILGLLSGLKYMLMPLKKFKAEIAEIDLILESINNL